MKKKPDNLTLNLVLMGFNKFLDADDKIPTDQEIANSLFLELATVRDALYWLEETGRIKISYKNNE